MTDENADAPKSTPSAIESDSSPTLTSPESSSPTAPSPRRFTAKEGGRSTSLYAVLGVGVAALLVLLGIIYFTAMDRENPDQPICTAIDPASAEQSVLDGKISRVVVNYDSEVEESTDPRWGPVLARVDYVDGGCGNLPQGVRQREAMAQVLGTIYLYNEITTQPRVEISLQGSENLDASLFVMPTIPPTETPIPSPTREPVATASTTASTTASPTVTEVVIETPVTTPTSDVVVNSSPSAEASESPVASPRATIVLEPTQTPADVASPEAKGSPAGERITATPTATP